MYEELELLKRITNALRWSVPYAEAGHEAMYPGETYEADKYVAHSVAEARSALKAAQDYLNWLHKNQNA
jgi:hypothetical protein